MTDEIRDEDDFIPDSDIKDGPNPGDRIVYLLERLVEGQNGYPSMTESVLAVFAAPQSYPNRMRVATVLISADTAGTFILNVGTTKYTFTMPANTTLPFRFPIVIENGLDVALTGTGTGRVWLTYTSE